MKIGLFVARAGNVVAQEKAAGEDLRCLDAKSGPPAATMIYAQLQQRAYAALHLREKELEKLVTPEQIRSYQAGLKRFFVRQLGGFPERT